MLNSGLKQNIYLFLIVSEGQELEDRSAGWFRFRTSHAVMVSQLQMELEWGRGTVLEQLSAGQHLFGSSGLFYAVSPPQTSLGFPTVWQPWISYMTTQCPRLSIKERKRERASLVDVAQHFII